MAFPVYSTRFVLSSNLATNPTYTVPVGKVMVVRDATCVLSSAGSVYLAILLNGIPVWQSGLTTTTAVEAPHFRGHIVGFAGDVLLLNANQLVGGQASGYLLTLP